ncbi:hypothetical protein PaeBR_09480 [Paenibacillus sp. BR2-3]|uniref:hypothetical protein n=1 Tax=Paenibacillus sp. BR2-3 TaxID=3048494 RepID=UPI003977E06B
MNMETEQLIRRMLEYMLLQASRNIVIFIGGGTGNEGYIADVLGAFRIHQYSFFVSEDWAPGTLEDKILERLQGKRLGSMKDLEEALRHADLVLLPLVNQSTLSRLALGITDTPMLEGLALAVMMGQKIIAVRDGYDDRRAVPLDRGAVINPAYHALIAGYESTLRSYGIRIIELGEFRSVLSAGEPGGETAPIQQVPSVLQSTVFNGTILTAADVQHMREGSLLLQAGTLITPLAKEWLTSQRIIVNYLENNGQQHKQEANNDYIGS